MVIPVIPIYTQLMSRKDQEERRLLFAEMSQKLPRMGSNGKITLSIDEKAASV